MRARAMRTATALLGLLPCGSPALRGQVAFTTRPTARREGRKVTIGFAVSAPTDVAISIENAKGEIVRHLVAGVLGQNSPAPLRRNSLEQSVEWDGTDDDGKPAQGGPFRCRVALGLKPRLHKIIGWSGQHLARVNGIAAGPDGTLYVIHSDGLYAHRSTWLVSAFGGDGRYLRQVFPGPANLPAAKREGWPRMRLDDGAEVPVIFHLLPRTTYPGAVFDSRMFPLVTGDGRLVVLSGPGANNIKHVDFRGGRRLLILGADGSVPADFLGPEVCPYVGGFGHIALAPDGRSVYATGFVSTGRKGKGPVHVVYRVALDGSEPSKALIGREFEAGSGKQCLKDPQGIATDAQGNIYVSDYGNGRVAIFRPDGSYLDEIQVECPDTVHVSRKTGSVYVVQLRPRGKPHTDGHWYTPAHNWRARRIVKFGGLKDKAERASFENTLKSSYGGGGFMALDESGPEPALWVAGLVYGGGPILKLADRGDRLEPLGEPLQEAAQAEKGRFLGFIGDVSVLGDKVLAQHPAFGNHNSASLVYSAETGEYLGTYVPKDATGKPENVWSLLYGETVAGNDGRLYYHARSNLIRRYDEEGRPIPFALAGKHFIEGFWHGHTRGAGLFVNRAGTIFVPAAPGNRQIEEMDVKVVDATGKTLRERAVRIENARVGGIAVDRAGNIYVGAQAVPQDERIPRGFAGKLPPDGPAHHPSLDYQQYGMIYKFPPQGGAIVKDPQGTFTAIAQYKHATVAVKNALWMRRLGYIGSHGDELGCHCETTRFDLDGYDRLFAPDIFRFRVCVLDSEGNEITSFGAWGNMDSRGPGSPVPQPEIPLGWPLSVECAGGRVFVADLVNRRVVAVRFEHAAEETCHVK